MTNTKSFSVSFAFALALGLTSCAMDQDTAAIKAMPLTGTLFQSALHGEYITVAELERAEADWDDTFHFNTKARLAGEGTSPSPDPVNADVLTPDKVETLTLAYENLTGALSDGAPEQAPEEAAKAQAQFDCWQKEVIENIKPNHEDLPACRNGYRGAMQAAKDKMAQAPKDKMAPAPIAPTASAEPIQLKLYFLIDSPDINAESVEQLPALLDAIRARPTGLITVVGHTDTAGKERHNSKLSEARAKAVQALLQENGIEAKVIEIEFKGESAPYIATENEVDEPLNRRVEITIR